MTPPTKLPSPCEPNDERNVPPSKLKVAFTASKFTSSPPSRSVSVCPSRRLLPWVDAVSTICGVVLIAGRAVRVKTVLVRRSGEESNAMSLPSKTNAEPSANVPVNTSPSDKVILSPRNSDPLSLNSPPTNSTLPPELKSLPKLPPLIEI